MFATSLCRPLPLGHSQLSKLCTRPIRSYSSSRESIALTIVGLDQENEPDAFFKAYNIARAKNLSNLLARFKPEELCSLASRLRDGIACTLPAFDDGVDEAARQKLVSAQMGGQNCHLDIQFQDNVTWIARIRPDDPTLPPAVVQDYISSSEVATLKWLEKLRIPTPKVYYHGLNAETNKVGVAFVLMEKMPGSPLDWSAASQEQRSKVLAQLVDVFIELERYPFQQLGSLIAGSRSSNVGPLAQSQTFESPDLPAGPEHSLRSYLEDMIQHQLSMIRSGELSSLPVDNYLSHLWRLEMLPTLLAPPTANSFYLKHFDDKGDHILVDENHNITAIIEWEFASVEAKELAFSSPCMMWPVSEFYDGSNELSLEETEFAALFADRGRQDLADLVRNGRRFQRFTFFLAGASKEQEDFKALFYGLRAAFKQKGDIPCTHREWRLRALQRYASDDGLREVLKREEQQQPPAEAAQETDNAWW